MLSPTLDTKSLFISLLKRIRRDLVLGSGNGEEFRPGRRWIEHLYIVESAQGYCQDNATTTYVKAREEGALDFPEDTFDTAVEIAVLHHIPNVSVVVRGLFRVLKAGGCCLAKEPTTSMGEWSGPRKAGLPPCERGIPKKGFDGPGKGARFVIMRKQYFEFPPIRRVRDQLGVDTWNSRFWVALDWWLCQATLWNYWHHRTSALRRLAPPMRFTCCANRARRSTDIEVVRKRVTFEPKFNPKAAIEVLESRPGIGRADFRVCRFTGLSSSASGDWKVPQTRRQKCLRYGPSGRAPSVFGFNGWRPAPVGAGRALSRGPS